MEVEPLVQREQLLRVQLHPPVHRRRQLVQPGKLADAFALVEVPPLLRFEALDEQRHVPEDGAVHDRREEKGDGAEGLLRIRLGRDVAVADGGARDHRPVE